MDDLSWRLGCTLHRYINEWLYIADPEGQNTLLPGSTMYIRIWVREYFIEYVYTWSVWGYLIEQSRYRGVPDLQILEEKRWFGDSAPHYRGPEFPFPEPLEQHHLELSTIKKKDIWSAALSPLSAHEWNFWFNAFRVLSGNERKGITTFSALRTARPFSTTHRTTSTCSLPLKSSRDL